MNPGIGLVLVGVATGLCPLTDPIDLRLAWLARTRLAPQPQPQPQPQGSQPDVPAGNLKRCRAAFQSQLAGAPRVQIWTICSVGLGAVGLLGQGMVVGLLCSVVTATLGWLWHTARANRAADASRAELMVAVTALSSELAAGAGLASAFEAAAPAHGRYRNEFLGAATAAARGEGLARCLGPAPALMSLAVACGVAEGSGGSLTTALATVRADLEADQAVRRAVTTALAGPRSSTLLLAGLPVLGVGLGSVMGADPARVLLHTGWGLTALCVGVLLDVSGLIWSLRLANRASP